MRSYRGLISTRTLLVICENVSSELTFSRIFEVNGLKKNHAGIIANENLYPARFNCPEYIAEFGLIILISSACGKQMKFLQTDL